MPLPKSMPKGRNPSKDYERVYANRYHVIKRLGSGNFGTVFLVKDTASNGERKCLKEIYVGELHPDETVNAMREAKLLSNLNHPNIVKYLDSFLDQEFFCIVTEYCEGGDLSEKITAWGKAGKTFDESLIIAWFIQIVLAVHSMHQKRVLHRDLKTRNIFLKNNVIKLGDFGISRILMGTSDMATTFTGTPYYMSPEVLKHEAYNHKSDMWSLGAILYELCNLKHPFQGQSLMGIMYKIVEGEPPELSNKYSQELHHLYKRLLSKDPSKRPNGSEILKNEYISSNMKKMSLQMQEKLSLSVHATSSQAKSIERPLTRSGRRCDINVHSQEEQERPLTPSDRLRLRKMQRADKEAERIKEFMAKQGNEAQEQCVSHKKKQNQVSLPWVDANPDVFSDPSFTLTSYDLSTTRETLVEGTGKDDNDFDLTTVSGIPEDADLAETYYSQFENEFDSDDELSANDDEKTLNNEDDYGALVGQLERALDSTESDLDCSLSDEVYEQAITQRPQRISKLTNDCIKLLGKEPFQQVYDYLKEARFCGEVHNDDSIMVGLGKIVKNPRDCFLVDQLLFLEKQAEIASMT